jgi:hypothetical protein
MEKPYKNIVLLFIAVAIFTFAGFFKSYFGLFPGFKDVKWVLHFHAFFLMAWIALLIVQPILIVQQQWAWHRWLGKISYGLAPLIVIFMLLAYHSQYERALANGKSHTEALGLLFSPFTDTLPFALYYLLAMIHRKNVAKHMRYIIATALIIMGPSLGRIFIIFVGMTYPQAIATVLGLIFFSFVGLLIYDRVKGRRFKVSPYAIALVIFSIPNALLFFVPKTKWWQAIAEQVVHTFF